MTTGGHRRLGQLERQIRLVDLRRTSYRNTMARAVTDGDTERAAEYARRADEAESALYGLRAQWMVVWIRVRDWEAKRV